EVVAPAGAFVHALGGAGVVGALFAVGAVQQLAAAGLAVGDGVVLHQAGQHLAGQLFVPGALFGPHPLDGFQQAAGHDGRRGGIARFLAAGGEDHVPVGHEVVGQAGQVEVQRPAEGVQVFGVAGVAVAQHAAVNAPRLAAGPEAVVPVALAGGAVAGGAVGVHEEGVVGGAVGPEGVGQAGGDVPVGDVGVLCVAGDLAGPV